MIWNASPNSASALDDTTNENASIWAQQVEASKIGAVRADKIATQTAQSANIVPQGGLFWDGRAHTRQIQAEGPLLDPREMDGGSPRDHRREICVMRPMPKSLRHCSARRES